MITQADIYEIIYRDCEVFDIPRYSRDNAPKGKITQERIVIIPKRGTPDTYWEKSYVEVNFCVPDKKGVIDEIRLKELERWAVSELKRKSGIWDDTRYRYSKESSGNEADEELGCHYVNVRLLFEILNV